MASKSGKLSESTRPGREFQILNLAVFSVTLVSLGGLLVFEFAHRSDSLEIATEENRALAVFPKLTWTGWVEGRFTLGVDEWIADHFPARAQFMAGHFWLEQRRGFRAEQEVTLYAVAIDTDADLEPLDGDLEALDGELVLDDFEFEDEFDGDLELDEGSADETETTRSEGILVSDGRAMQLFAGGPKGSRHYAAAINGYAEALRGKLAIYVLILPTAQTFYLPESYTGRIRHEPPNIAATYAMLDPTVKSIDVVGALSAHTDEYIYFRTDHHWTGLGAYYAYAEFSRSAGFDPIALESMEKRVIEPFRGSLYSYTRDEKLRGRPDQVEYWLPPVAAQVERLTSTGKRTAYAEGALLREQSNGYGVFLGGDHPLLVARTANQSGRRALLVKNSYGNPFAVYLVSHFDEVVIVDYRKFDASLLELIEDHQITDLIFINGAITANAKTHIARLAKIMKGPKRKRGAQKPAP